MSPEAEQVARVEQMLESTYQIPRMPLGEAQAWLERIAHSEDIDPPLLVKAKLPPGICGLALLDQYVVVVQHSRPSKLTLLHELTHCIGHETHGPSFRNRFAELLGRHLSHEIGQVFTLAISR